MSWKKYFSPVTTTQSGTVSPIYGSGGKPGPARSNYSSYLPDVYSGSPNRVERYLQYDTMDWDSEVNAALDILAEFCTQKNKENNTPFTLQFRGSPTTSEVGILKEYLQQWTKMQKLDTRMFRIARNLFKYGDGFFLRDPETQKFFYVDPSKITKIIVNESEGKQPEQYVIRDININFQHLVVTQINPNTQNQAPGAAPYTQGGGGGRGMVGTTTPTPGSRFSLQQNEHAIDAKHVVHLSLSEGLDNNYPFGNSLLESVFKVYKQKELLEDAIIIYRVQRAPERRVFYIDVGNMPSHLAMGFVERVKNEIHQRRIPSSYLPTGADDSQSQYNDGRVGTAYIQELRFNKYCERLQNLMVTTFDTEFKLFLHNRGVNIDFSLFEIRFQSPQNFAAYRQAELDNQRIATFAQMVALPFVSKRFALKRFLGMTDEDLKENEKMWQEESGEGRAPGQDAAGQLRGAGVSPTGMEADTAALDGTEEAPEDMEMPDAGAEMAAPAAGSMPA